MHVPQGHRLQAVNGLSIENKCIVSVPEFDAVHKAAVWQDLRIEPGHATRHQHTQHLEQPASPLNYPGRSRGLERLTLGARA